MSHESLPSNTADLEARMDELIMENERAWRSTELGARSGPKVRLTNEEFVPGDPRWQAGANCNGVDPDLFFPERGESTREAKEVCKGCVVREDCLEYALESGEKWGIWGGLSERERRKVRRRRAMERRAGAVAVAEAS